MMTDIQMPPELTKWPKFYMGRTNVDYYNYVRRRYGPFIEMIKLLCDSAPPAPRLGPLIPPPAIVEFGCGIGNITRSLFDGWGDNSNYNFLATDNNPLMLNLAEKHIGFDDVYIKFLDITRPINGMRALMGHSHGVLEHFNRYEIARIIGSLRQCCSMMVHYVPTDKYEKPSFGDELLMSVDEWKEICAPDETRTFNDNHDLMLIWNRA